MTDPVQLLPYAYITHNLPNINFNLLDIVNVLCKYIILIFCLLGPACPSPPTSNLAARGYNSSDEFSQHSRSSSQSPRQGRRTTTGGAYRPLFNTSSKVLGVTPLARFPLTRIPLMPLFVVV